MVISTLDYKASSKYTPARPASKSDYNQLNIAIMGISSRLATFQDDVLARLNTRENEMATLNDSMQLGNSQSDNLWDLLREERPYHLHHHLRRLLNPWNRIYPYTIYMFINER